MYHFVNSPSCWWRSCGHEMSRRFLIIFVNYMYTDNLLEPSWVVLVKKYTKPSGQHISRKSWSGPDYKYLSAEFFATFQIILVGW